MSWGPAGRFLIVDYPEEQPQQVAEVLRALSETVAPKHRLRILHLSDLHETATLGY